MKHHYSAFKKENGTFNPSWPVRATIRLMPLDMASSETIANDSIWPDCFKCLSGRILKGWALTLNQYNSSFEMQPVDIWTHERSQLYILTCISK